jgi:TonB family protein
VIPTSRIAIGIFFLLSAAPYLGAASAASDDQDLRDATLYAPKPDYPFYARSNHVTGSGIAIITIDKSTGKVIDATMAISTESKELDAAALEAFRRWKFKPNTVTKAKIPITFTMAGKAYVIVKAARPMNVVLAPFLGRENVLKAPVPRYPLYASWSNKEGSGVYRMDVDKNGRVVNVKTLKSSGDATFDHAAVGALRQWRFRRGPGTLQLPLAFNLTPHSFNVRMP